MIWNDKLLFVHVPKTGGMSVTEFLLDNLALPVHYTSESKAKGKKRARYHDGRRHETLIEAEAFLNAHGDRSISDFEVVVAVMRNPYDLEVSRYHYLQKGKSIDKGRAQDLALAGDYTTYLREAPFFGAFPPRIDRYFTIMGAMPDNLRIIRYEHLEEDFQRLVGPYLANRNARLPRVNASQRSHWQDYYLDDETEQLCYDRHSWFFDKGFYSRYTAEPDVPVETVETPLYHGTVFPDIPVDLLGSAGLMSTSVDVRGRRVYSCLIEQLGVDDLAERRVLDVGCGPALGHDIVTQRRPVGAYLGLEQEGPVLDLLREVVPDEPFAYGSLQVGGGLAAAAVPGHGAVAVTDRFDTVFVGQLLRVTPPADLVALLQLCREHAATDAVLVASIGLKEPSDEGNAVFDHIVRLGITDELQQAIDAADPYGPLPNGTLLHSREGLTALMERAGWSVVSFSQPRPGLGHVVKARRRD